MKIFKELSKKGYKHYYEGTVEELDSMNKDNQYLHLEIMQVIMWLYEKHEIWINVIPYNDEELSQTLWENTIIHISDNYNDCSDYTFYHSPTEAYETAIEYTLTKLI